MGEIRFRRPRRTAGFRINDSSSDLQMQQFINYISRHSIHSEYVSPSPPFSTPPTGPHIVHPMPRPDLRNLFAPISPAPSIGKENITPPPRYETPLSLQETPARTPAFYCYRTFHTAIGPITVMRATNPNAYANSTYPLANEALENSLK